MKNKIAPFARRRDCIYAFDSSQNGILFSALGGDLIPHAPDQMNSEKSWFENTGLFTNNKCTFENGIVVNSAKSAYLKTPVTFFGKQQNFTIAETVCITHTKKSTFCFQCGDTANTWNLICVLLYFTDAKTFRISLWDSAGLRINVATSGTYETGWHRVAQTCHFDGTETTVKLFVDGELSSSSTFGLAVFSGTFLTLTSERVTTCHVGDNTAATRNFKFRNFLIFNNALQDSEVLALLNAMPETPEKIEKETTYSATLDAVFKNPASYSGTSQENPVHIVPDPGKVIYYEVNVGSNIIYLDFSAYTTVTVNCSGFTKINDKLYSITGSFYPWITGDNNTLTSIIINQD